MIARLGFIVLAFTVIQGCREAEAQQNSDSRRIAVTRLDAEELEDLAEKRATIAARIFLRRGQTEKARRILEQLTNAQLELSDDTDNSERHRAVIDKMKSIRRLPLRRNCDDVGSKCLGVRGAYFVLPPYKLAEPREVLREGIGCGLEGKEFALVRRAEIRSPAISTVARWRALARKGSVFACKGPVCITIAETLPEPEGSAYGLAACLVSKVGSVLGAPTGCVEIYRKDKTGERYRAVIGMQKIACMIGRPDFEFIVRRSGDESISTILAQSKKALAGAPLNLQTEIHENYVLGVSDRRVSSVLSGYRETVTVRIDIRTAYPSEYWEAGSRPTSPDQPGSKSDLEEALSRARILRQPGSSFGTVVSTALMVNKQNTDRPVDWRLPDPSQQDDYVRAVRTALRDQLSGLCLDAKWMDDRILLCPKVQ